MLRSQKQLDQAQQGPNILPSQLVSFAPLALHAEGGIRAWQVVLVSLSKFEVLIRKAMRSGMHTLKKTLKAVRRDSKEEDWLKRFYSHLSWR